MKIVRSADNPRYKALLRLVQSSAERRAAGLSVLDGTHLVSAYHRTLGTPEQLVVSDAGRRVAEIAALLAALPQADTLVLGDALFARLSSVVTPTGLIGIVRTPRPTGDPRLAGTCVMLEDIQDPGNLGSILRSAAAAGVRQVLLSKHAVNAWSPRVLRAGMGAHFVLQVHERVDLVATARAYAGQVLAASQSAPATIFEADLLGDVAFVFGNEGGGITADLLAVAHGAVAIPMPGGTDSLNVAAAAAVCLFERVRQIAAAGRQ